jgi:hypothetical protein
VKAGRRLVAGARQRRAIGARPRRRPTPPRVEELPAPLSMYSSGERVAALGVAGRVQTRSERRRLAAAPSSRRRCGACPLFFPPWLPKRRPRSLGPFLYVARRRYRQRTRRAARRRAARGGAARSEGPVGPRARENAVKARARRRVRVRGPFQRGPRGRAGPWAALCGRRTDRTEV